MAREFLLACSSSSTGDVGGADASPNTNDTTDSGKVPSADGGDEGDAADEGDAGSEEQALSCSEKLANPTSGGKCATEDEGKPCEDKCLTCRCENGKWQPCTTKVGACFADGG